MTHHGNPESADAVNGLARPLAHDRNQEPVLPSARSWPTPIPRRRVGRFAVLEWIRQEVGAGRGVPDAHRIAARFGWRVTSGQDVLTRLAADGLLRAAGREPPHGRTLYELTAAGSVARSKVCARCQARKPDTSFWPSRYGRDGLSEWCRSCQHEADGPRRRHRRRAQALAAAE